MAKTPTQTRRRPKAKSTPRATWHDRLAAVVVPFTKQQQDEIRAVLSRRQASQLLRDWPRIGEIAWWHAHFQHAVATSKSNTPKVQNKRRKTLNNALTALDKIVPQLDVYVEKWGPIRKSWFPFETTNTPEVIAAVMRQHLQEQRQRVTWFLRQEQINPTPTTPAKMGRPPTPETHILEVLLAYFRHHQWDDAIPPTSWSSDRYRDHPESLFVLTAWAVVVQRTLSAAARRALKDSTLVWATLDDHAPRLSPEQRSRRARTNPLGQRSRREAETEPSYDPLFKPTGDISRFFTITSSKKP